jgi:hypothetical protein
MSFLTKKILIGTKFPKNWRGDGDGERDRGRGAITFSRTTLSIMTLNRETLGIITKSKMTLNIIL